MCSFEWVRGGSGRGASISSVERTCGRHSVHSGAVRHQRLFPARIAVCRLYGGKTTPLFLLLPPPMMSSARSFDTFGRLCISGGSRNFDGGGGGGGKRQCVSPVVIIEDAHNALAFYTWIRRFAEEKKLLRLIRGGRSHPPKTLIPPAYHQLLCSFCFCFV